MKLTTLTLVLSPLVTTFANAAELAVLPVQGTNLEAGEIEAIGVLLANAYAAESKLDVLGPVEVAKRQETVDAAGGTAALVSALGVKEYVEVSAVRLKTKITIRAAVREAGGEVVHAVDMTAASLDDLDQVAERMAKALFNRTTIAAAQTIHNVTKTEGKVPNRTFSQQVLGLKTAFTLPVARGLRFQPMMSLSFDGRYETDKGFLEFGIGVALPTMSSHGKSMGGLFTEFGGNYYLGGDSTSPYVGGGVIPRIYWGIDDGGVRAAIYGQAGLMFMRESSTRMYTELRIAQNVLPFTGHSHDVHYPLYDPPGKSHDYYPTELSLNVGIGW
jgi:hypothetical protein